jgi:hypothetical protein
MEAASTTATVTTAMLAKDGKGQYAKRDKRGKHTKDS